MIIVPRPVCDQLQSIRRSRTVNMTDPVDVAIEADRLGFDELASFIADDLARYRLMVVEGYRPDSGPCICIDDEAESRAVQYADLVMGSLDHWREAWLLEGGERLMSFEQYASPWFEAAQLFKSTDPQAGKADPDCPMCGGTGITRAEEWIDTTRT